MLRFIISLVFTITVLTGCTPGSGAGNAERNEGPLGPDDLPEGIRTQVTTIAAKTSEDEGEQAWRATEHRYATLSRAGDPLEVVFIMDHPTRSFDTALTYTYDEQGRKRLETAWHWKKDQGWTEISRVETSYDEQGRPARERATSRDAEGWIDARLVQYGYDHPDGAVSRVISVPRYDNEGMPDHTGTGSDEATMWRNDQMEERYMTTERIDSVRWYSWQDGQWHAGNRSVYSYDSAGDPIESTIYRQGTHAWIPFMRTTFHETDDGEQVSLIHHRRGSNWVVTRRETKRTTQAER